MRSKLYPTHHWKCLPLISVVVPSQNAKQHAGEVTLLLPHLQNSFLTKQGNYVTTPFFVLFCPHFWRPTSTKKVSRKLIKLGCDWGAHLCRQSNEPSPLPPIVSLGFRMVNFCFPIFMAEALKKKQGLSSCGSKGPLNSKTFVSIRTVLYVQFGWKIPLTAIVIRLTVALWCFLLVTD